MFSILKIKNKILKIKIFFIKIMLSATSLAPIIAVFGLSEWERNNWSKDYLTCFIFWNIPFPLMVGVCAYVLYRFEKKPGRLVPIKKIERKDNDILSFLFIFLLPFIRSDNSSIINHPVTSIVCVFIVLYVIADIGSYNFNPTLRILRYHIYSISTLNAGGLLIAKTEGVLHGSDMELIMVELSNDYQIYLHTKKIKEN